MAPASSKEFLDIQATVECGFTLKLVRDMIKTYNQTYLCLLLLNLKLSNTNWAFTWKYKRLYARKSQKDAASKQSDHFENYVTTNDSFFFNFLSLFIATGTYHASKIWYIYEHTLPEF